MLFGVRWALGKGGVADFLDRHVGYAKCYAGHTVLSVFWPRTWSWGALTRSVLDSEEDVFERASHTLKIDPFASKTSTAQSDRCAHRMGAGRQPRRHSLHRFRSAPGQPRQICIAVHCHRWQ
eukprot:SAG11_NODE_770_length_7257_cov_2.448449_7_plen_122_part_00